MPIDVEHVGGVLLSASADHQIWQRNGVATTAGKFALRRFGRRHRCVIDPQITVRIKVFLQRCEVRRGPSAVQDLHPRDHAHTQLAVLHERCTAPHPRGFVEQDQRHASSPRSAPTSTSWAARSRPAR